MSRIKDNWQHEASPTSHRRHPGALQPRIAAPHPGLRLLSAPPAQLVLNNGEYKRERGGKHVSTWRTPQVWEKRCYAGFNEGRLTRI